MPPPPLLLSDIEKLRKDGYDVSVEEANGEIGIILKGYEVPGDIWSPTRTDLLVVAHQTYPRAKMDMFWVSPSLSLKGGAPRGATPAEKFGRSWQQFSWHTPTWDPAKDNLLTHLRLVEDRLGRAERVELDQAHHGAARRDTRARLGRRGGGRGVPDGGLL